MARSTSLFPTLKTKIMAWRKLSLGPSKTNMSEQRGQALVMWMVFLSVILLVTIGCTSAWVLIQDRQRLMTLCRIQSLHTFRDVQRPLEHLLSLNPQSKILRTWLALAQAKLALALSTSNVPLATEARIEIREIRRKQKILDQTQKQLIQLANLKLHSGVLKTSLDLQKTFRDIQKKNLGWSQTTFILQNPYIPKLAVRAEDHRLAPIYLPLENFERRQASTQAWTQVYQLTGFLHYQHKSHSQCNATLEEKTWIPKIRRDKPLLKWLS